MTKRMFVALRVGLVLTFVGVGTICFAQDHPSGEQSTVFRVGFAKRNITPTGAVPMWGYGDRHDDLAEGLVDPLLAKAIVIDIGTGKLAMVGLDLGRSPTDAMMAQIRKAVSEQAGVSTVLINGSHTHHGPVIELLDREGCGKGKFDVAVAYSKKLPSLLIDAIVEAAGNVEPAKVGWRLGGS